MDLLIPGSYAYLDDFVYIDHVDLTGTNSHLDTTIAAYDLRSFEGQRGRIIAFADGHVETLGDERARPMFEAQGLKYPGASKSDGSE